MKDNRISSAARYGLFANSPNINAVSANLRTVRSFYTIFSHNAMPTERDLEFSEISFFRFVSPDPFAGPLSTDQMTAIASISTFAPFGIAAAWNAALAGNGSWKNSAYTSFIAPNSDISARRTVVFTT